MKKMLKRLCTGFLALATVVTALPTTPVHAESKQYWTESKERVGIVEKVMNDGSIGSTFNEGHLTVEGEDAYCIDINTDFKNGYKTRADASTRMSADQISDVALSIEYVKQYTDSHNGISKNHAYLLRQLVVWQRLSVHLGWQCDNVRASYDEIPKATQDEVFAGAKAFVKENKGRYECGGYIYSGEGQELGQFWAKLNVGNAKLQKTSSNTSITDGNGNYSIAGATYGVFADKDCTKQLATLTTDENGNTDVVEVTADTVYIKELSAPAGYKVDTNIYSLKVEAGKTATLNVSDTPKVTDTLIELFKIDMETQKDNPQGNASLAGAEFTWKYYTGFYNKDKYVYGGSNPNTSFDCSGLTQWCYGKAGISLPRTAQAQYDATQHLPLSQAKAGDLVFFHSTYNAGSYVTHVGILVSPTQMYHAGDPIGYADLSSSYWQQHLIGAGRVKQ